jgi:hypothetical protein
MVLLLTVGFLCKRVSKSTIDDEKKPKGLLEYVKGTFKLNYVLGAVDLQWVDVSYVVHEDMKSHTGGVTSFGTGGLLGKSTKQKLNTKSATEAELVGSNDYLPHILWTKFLMEAQGQNMSRCTMEQNNESAMKLEMHGKSSAGPRSRHINIRYFWKRDVTKNNNKRI